MTLRERILSVYRGETPDVVPYMLDLSHWFYHKHRLPWDLSQSYDKPESDLIAYHRQVGAGFYLPNLGGFWKTSFSPDVTVETIKHEVAGAPEIVWRIHTPLGVIERHRRWEEQTYAWGISRWGIQTADDLRVFGYAMSRRTFTPRWENYWAWMREIGDGGVLYLIPAYSAMGHLLNYWMGVEGVAYALADYPDVLHEVVDAVTTNSSSSTCSRNRRPMLCAWATIFPVTSSRPRFFRNGHSRFTRPRSSASMRPVNSWRSILMAGCGVRSG